MDYQEYNEFSEIILASFIKKPTNRENITKALWKLSNKDVSYAKYLLYEIFADYMVSPKLDELFSNIQQNHLGWNHHDFQSLKKNQKEYDDFLMNPPQLEEGVIECSRCGSKKTFSFSKQTRRADESATVFVRCADCGKSFRM